MAKLISSKHLEGVSDLTLTAPIKQGFIHAFESVTYETRLRLLLKALFKIRSTAREYSALKPFVDTSERIQSLLDFRLAVLDTEPRRLLLSATFDRPFEPYMRLIWRPLGTLLDVIFCNCDGYVTATEHSFEEYLAWVRSAQVDTGYFYAMTGHSVDDYQYVLKIDRLERLRRARRPGDPDPEDAIGADDLLQATGPRAALKVDTPPQIAAAVRAASPENRATTDFLGLEALVSLYRLTDFYPPDDPNGDGELLRQAARQLLEGWDDPQRPLPPAYESELLIKEQLRWFRTALPRPTITRAAAAEEPATEARLPFRLEAVQGGIVHGYGSAGSPVRHGALLLMQILDPGKARRFLGKIGVTSGAQEAQAPQDGIYRNLAFTRHGLENIGIPARDLATLPQEFREGMEERAGLLGDLRSQHPRNWHLPKRNWPPHAWDGPAKPPVVELSEVDLVVQLRTACKHPADEGDATSDEQTQVTYDVAGDPDHPLHAAVKALAAEPDSGLELLAVEAIHRASKGDDEFGKDHFGFRDGFSQPRPVDREPNGPDEVRAGEIFRGYSTDRSDPPARGNWLLDDGTFLVVRKLRQNVERLHAFVAETARREGIDPEMLYALMVGRSREGAVLRPGVESTANEFDFAGDANGAVCPYQSHIRRTNPRTQTHGRTTPRILRRGLSWGPAAASDGAEPPARGIMFMAYCGSLAEQYEVIQRWVNGGNSSGIGSWLSDPLMGAPAGETRTFRFARPQNAGRPADGDDGTITIEIKEPFVELHYGAYLFVPSMAAIETIAGLPSLEEEARLAEEQEAAERGRLLVEKLLAEGRCGSEGRAAAAAGWKALLEDFGSKDPAEKADAPAAWAAIRRYHGGALRVPYPDMTRGGEVRTVVLAAGKDQVMEVFQNPDGHYSMCGQRDRMKQSFGDIFLGMDGGCEYQNKSAINPVIYGIREEDAFAVAYAAAQGMMAGALPKIGSARLPKLEIDLRRHFITPVLGLVCHHWFGIPDDPDPAKAQFVQLAGWQWQPVGTRKPSCPGDYMATSRYCFYPDPGLAVQDYGKAQGQALRKAVRARLQKLRSDGFPPEAPLALAMSQMYVDDDETARTLIGVMTGFLPPTDGSLRWSLYEWLEEKTLWRIQNAYLAGVGTPYERAKAAIDRPLRSAMQKRPSPDMLWRTATCDHSLGGAEVRAGERVLIGIVSAMAEDVAAGRSDVYPVFGGMRKPADAPQPGPLHACPAYKFALGTMLGMLAALFDGLEIKALPAPLLVEISPRRQARPGSSAQPGAVSAQPEARPN